MAYRRRAVARRPAQRRKLVWARNQLSNLDVLPATVSTFDPLAGFEVGAGSQVFGATIVRFRARVLVIPNLVENSNFVMGGIIDEGPIPATPVTVGPISQPHKDWFIYEPWCYQTNAGWTNVNPSEGGREVDVKAARKLEELDSQFRIYFECTAGGGYNVSIFCSTLLMLH